jgi:hypothetical protein
LIEEYQKNVEIEDKPEKKEEPQKPFVKSVIDFQKRLKFYEKVIFYTNITTIVLAAINFQLMINDPVVILEKDGEKLSFHSERKEVEVTEKEIIKLVENFIHRRYEWDTFSTDGVLAELSPIISVGLKEKLASDLEKEAKTSKNELFSQYVGKVKVTIDKENNIIGTFDKILRVQKKITGADGDLLPLERIPLISEAQVMIKVIRGMTTSSNPLGLYINGVINYEPR